MWRLKLEARSWEGQQVEARIGCAILNRMIHLGKPESYQVEVRSCSLGRTGKHANHDSCTKASLMPKWEIKGNKEQAQLARSVPLKALLKYGARRLGKPVFVGIVT